MPLYEFMCAGGHIKESFFHRAKDRDTTVQRCDECGKRMKPVISRVSALLWFEEGRARRFDNLNTLDENGNEVRCPELTSWKDHTKQMEKAGVTEAGNRRGEKGNWV